MSNLRNAISDFLDGFGPGMLFSSTPRRGAATQVFADDEVPCHPEVQQAFEATADHEKRLGINVEQGRWDNVGRWAKGIPVDQDEELRVQKLSPKPAIPDGRLPDMPEGRVRAGSTPSKKTASHGP